MKSLFFCSALIGLTATNGWANEVPEYVTIKEISYGGSGCPAGTVSQNVAGDKKAFTLVFSEFLAEVAPWLPASDARTNCQINLSLEFPQGWTYSVAKFDYRGYAALDPRVTGMHKTTYYFQGQSNDVSFEWDLAGEFDNDYHSRDVISPDALLWSPCDKKRAINIKSDVRVNNSRNRNGFGFMTQDSQDGAILHTFGLRWRRC